jgi:hypothetical protein
MSAVADAVLEGRAIYQARVPSGGQNGAERKEAVNGAHAPAVSETGAAIA